MSHQGFRFLSRKYWNVWYSNLDIIKLYNQNLLKNGSLSTVFLTKKTEVFITYQEVHDWILKILLQWDLRNLVAL